MRNWSLLDTHSHWSYIIHYNTLQYCKLRLSQIEEVNGIRVLGRAFHLLRIRFIYIIYQIYQDSLPINYQGSLVRKGWKKLLQTWWPNYVKAFFHSLKATPFYCNSSFALLPLASSKQDMEAVPSLQILREFAMLTILNWHVQQTQASLPAGQALRVKKPPYLSESVG